MFIKNKILPVLALLTLAGCSTMDHVFVPSMEKASLYKPAPYVAPAVIGKRKFGNPYTILGKKYYPLKSSEGYKRKGIASWYGKDFHAKKTANGEKYNMYDMTAAHPTLPLPTYVRVTNLDNGLSTVVRVNDRGPFVRGRIIDLSYKAAITLDMHIKGTSPVLLEALPTDGSILRGPKHFAPRPKMAHNEKTGENVASPAFANYVNKLPMKSRTGGGFTDRISNKNIVETDSLKPVKTPTAESNDLNIGAVEIYVQTGAFSNLANATKQRAHVSSIFRNVQLQQYKKGEDLLYRVRVGPLSDIRNADSVLMKVIKNGWVNSRIVID